MARLLQILGLGNERHRQNVGVAGRILGVHTETDSGVELGALDLVVIGRRQGGGIDQERAIRRIFGPRIHQLGAVLDIQGDTLGADAVTFFDCVAVTLLQHHVGAVGHGHRGFEGDGRLLAQLALGGYAGNLIRRLGRGRLRGVALGIGRVRATSQRDAHDQRAGNGYGFGQGRQSTHGTPHYR